jgi:hypothetical protein
MTKPLTWTSHAKIRLQIRKIDPKWIEETVYEPDWTEIDPRDSSVERRFRAISQFGG